MGLLAAAIIAIATMGQTVPVQIPRSDLTGVTWTWLRSDYNDDSSVVALIPVATHWNSSPMAHSQSARTAIG